MTHILYNIILTLYYYTIILLYYYTIILLYYYTVVHTYIPSDIGVRDDAVLVCLDECIELDFAVERDDVLFDIIDH